MLSLPKKIKTQLNRNMLPPKAHFFSFTFADCPSLRNVRISHFGWQPYIGNLLTGKCKLISKYGVTAPDQICVHERYR